MPRWQVVLAQAFRWHDIGTLAGCSVATPRTHDRHPIGCGVALCHARCNGTFGVWFDKPRTPHRMADGIDARVSCDYEPPVDSDMVTLWRVFPEYGRARLVRMDNEIQSVNVWAYRFSAEPLP